jgi:adenosine deaminase
MVPITLHAGELTSKMAQNTRLHNHIQKSIYVGHAQRIGHGAALFDEDHYLVLVKTMVKQDIAVEINLTSNQDILSLSGRKHPLPFYLKHKVPVVLSTDDAGISATNLTKEFFKATNRYALDYPTIKRINRNALTYSFLPGKNLWSDSYHQIPVSACKNLMDVACQKFIEKSQKARLQYTLEKKLAVFEARWTSSHAP